MDLAGVDRGSDVASYVGEVGVKVGDVGGIWSILLVRAGCEADMEEEAETH